MDNISGLKIINESASTTSTGHTHHMDSLYFTI